MNFYLIGIDYKRASLYEREKAYYEKERIKFFSQKVLMNASALFTCNRVEIYGLTEDKHSANREINLIKSAFPEIFREAYVKNSTFKTLEHALGLASGIESQIIGEAEILKQLYSWRLNEIGAFSLKYFWSKVLSSSAKIKEKAGLIKGRNIAEIVIKDIYEGDPNNKRKKIVIVGTGKVADLFAEVISDNIEMFFVSGKKQKRSRQLAKKAKGEAVILDNLTDIASEVDVLISATSSPHYVVSFEQMFEISKRRKNNLKVYDLAVPRDVEPISGSIPGIFLKNLDDFNEDFKKYNGLFSGEINKAKELIYAEAEIIEKELIENVAKGWNKAEPAGIKTG
jgi:glutamyl-tRNA reductase